MPRVIIEGLTGFGKTSTIRAMLAARPARLYDEDATFDDFMTKVTADPLMPREERTGRLEGILDGLERETAAGEPADCIFERFHLTYHALDGDWSTYRAIDERAAALGMRIVLLNLPDESLAGRSLYRAEYGGADWQGRIEHLGSESAALADLRLSQQRRRDALQLSALPHLVVDTREMDWVAYATRIWSWSDVCEQ
jgi:hypothetical protein